MLALSDFDHDSRLQREARTLALAGWQVDLLVRPSPSRPKGVSQQFAPNVRVLSVGLPASAERVRALIRRVRRRRSAEDPVGVVPGPLDSAPSPAAPTRNRVAEVLLEALALLAIEISFWSAVRGRRPAVVHVHDAEPLRVGAWVAFRRRVPLILDLHEFAASEDGRSTLSRRLADVTLRRLARRATCILTVGDAIADLLLHHYELAERPRVVPNLPSDSGQEVEGLVVASGLRDCERLAVHLGGVSQSRGSLLLVEALSRVEGLGLVFLGSCPPEHQDQLVALAACLGCADRLAFVPSVPSDHVVAWARTADLGVVAVQPTSRSHEVALPNKILESAAAGLPLVVTALPDMRALVERLGSGVAVDPPDSVDALVDGLVEVGWTNHERFSRAAHLAASSMTWDAAAPLLTTIYEDLSSRVAS